MEKKKFEIGKKYVVYYDRNNFKEVYEVTKRTEKTLTIKEIHTKIEIKARIKDFSQGEEMAEFDKRAPFLYSTIIY